MTTFKKLTTTVFAAAVLLTGMASTNQANASGLTREEAAIIAGTGGFILGTLIGSSHRTHRSRVIYVEDRWDAHVSRCLSRYRSYDPSTDTYVGYDGYERRCRL